MAEKLMRENQLADWCLATEYEAKALAWIVNVMPNTPYVHAAADAGEIIIDMMPDCLMADKRRLSSELKKNGMITNLREVMRECSAVVFDAQSKHEMARHLTPPSPCLQRSPLHSTCSTSLALAA